MRRALLPAVAVALVAAAPASGHSVMKVEGGTIHYTATDDVSLNDLTVTATASEIRFRDPGANGGIQKPDECNPGATDTSGNFVEMNCPRSGITTIRIDVGEAQDEVVAQVPIAILALGGPGADTITTGDADDIVNGGGGNDVARTGGGNDQLLGDAGDDQLTGEAGDDAFQGGAGGDVADGGAGNDDLRIRDGLVDRGQCGDGADTVQADEGDQLDACETVDEVAGVAPPPENGGGGGGGGGPAPPDTAAPRVRAGGSTLQRVGRSGRVTVLATASEAGEVVAAGYVTVGGRRLVLRAVRAPVTVGGGGVRLRLRLEPRDARTLRRLLLRRRRAVARISVIATDVAGNSASARLPRIALRP
ncbi:MAG TPA: hypothetical protein VHF89_02800 [Solirubrobacteraceae bacterium]|nr:hypothetical protein [Solirubrobacteraceae bacterium]